MRWVRLRLGRACSDNGSVSLLALGCSLGFGLAGKVVTLSRQIGQEQAQRLAIGHLVLKGASGRSCRASVGVGRTPTNLVRSTLLHHYREVLARGP